MTVEIIEKPKVLISSIMMAEHPELSRARLPEFEVDFLTSGQFLTEQEISDYLVSSGPIDGWIAGDDEITDNVLHLALPRLKIISKWGSGLDSIDVESAHARGVVVTNSPGEIATAVAEVGVSYAIDLLRNLSTQDRLLRQGKWSKIVGKNLSGMNVGLIGHGRIGKKISAVLRCFDARVLIHDPAHPSSIPLGQLLGESGVLFLCAPLTENTRGLIGRSAISQMKTGAVIINLARGPIIVEKDLIDGIISGKIGGAALDVYNQEPPVLSDEFKSLPNVIFGCHNANNSETARESVNEEACENLRYYLRP